MLSHETYTFHAIDDFPGIKDPKERLEAALEFGIRITESRNLDFSDIRSRSGPFFRFKMRAKGLVLGLNNDSSFFIRKVVIPANSNIELHYYDLATGRESVAEIYRKPGLNICFKSGWRRNLNMYIHVICTRENHVAVLDRFGARTDIA